MAAAPEERKGSGQLSICISTLPAQAHQEHNCSRIMSDKFKRFLPFLVVAFVVSIVLLWQPTAKAPVEELTRARLELLMDQKTIVSANLTPKAYKDIYQVTGTYQKGIASPKVDFTITTHLTEGQVQALLGRPNSSVNVPKTSTRTRVMELMPTLVIASIVIFLLIYQTNFGRGKSTHRVRQRPSIRFDDVAGIEEAKSEVQEVIDFLRDPAKYNRLGGNLPKGILLIGPPGTGKTMLAKAIAGEANASFFSASGSDFNEVYVGVGAKRVRELFKQARASKPAIIFIDEIDCLG
ncbi:MAG: AAA family ATPase, partial [Candidatus Binatia bacterium]